MPITCLIFDFDGLVLDTETPEADAWRAIYAEHGFTFPFERWSQIVGGNGLGDFDAAGHLADLARGTLDPRSLRLRHKAESAALILAEPIMPGVVNLLDEARRLGLKLGVASSSPHSWVDTHLTRLGLFDRFDAVICADDVPAGRIKPHPDLFVKALAVMNASPAEAMVFEDSPNGVRAARAAGLFVVAVPNRTTKGLQFEGASRSVSSLDELTLDSLLREFA